MTTPNDFNEQIMKEFRANGGKVGGNFAGAPMLILTSTGAKSGKPRTNPLVYLPDGDDLIVFASKAGAPESPAWYHNLRANPQVQVEVGKDTVTAKAEVVSEPERTALYARQVAVMPTFAEYEEKTSRTIPVVRLRKA
ncbi:MAG: nitroreductase family deazaflavin-dependent oxidoreductase [Dehalococcoidia bacterium]|nr:nitroreductase family deazaflavin-dependent oxidoreductase [Dehalococcoidia bacterium]MCA9845812.1 nitroreductase family deazaflavin-dependent oxidoreductase [Dehalococcoidia bacterium]MCA9855110.1 nitroreductase family deazaflavin-dependent oxidoreductase [Dehalococcoidia bacterium]